MNTYNSNTSSMDFQPYMRPLTAVNSTMSNQIINSPAPNMQTSFPTSPTVICPLNCICCHNYQMKKPCYCHAQKTTTASQTESGDFLRLQSDETTYFKRGTFAHSLLQRTIVSVNKKFNLRSKKDPDFGRAVMEVLTNFPDIPFTTENHSKIASRMAKAISWKKYYATKSREAANTDMTEANKEDTNNTEANKEIENPTEINMRTNDTDSSDDEILLSAFKEKRN